CIICWKLQSCWCCIITERLRVIGFLCGWDCICLLRQCLALGWIGRTTESISKYKVSGIKELRKRFSQCLERLLTRLYFCHTGLCTDWAFWLQFTRIYLTTRKNLGSDTSAQIPFNTSPPVANDSNNEFYPRIVEHPQQLLLLVLGSFIHVIGNIANSVWISSAVA